MLRPLTVLVPRINDDWASFQSLFAIDQQVLGDDLAVTFDFSGCDFLRQNAVAFLAGLVRGIELRGGTARVDWSTVRPKVLANLERNGFCQHCGMQSTAWQGNSIPLRHDVVNDPAGVLHYLKHDWLGRGWVGVSPALRDAICGTVWEIYANAFEHSASPVGVLSCGQHFPNRRELTLTVLDFGVGIPHKVRHYFGNLALPADQAMRWAFEMGTSTKPAATSRGVGLNLLKAFVRANNGRIEVYSGDGRAIISRDVESYHTSPPMVRQPRGTVLNFTFVCDDAKYKLASEGPIESYF